MDLDWEPLLSRAMSLGTQFLQQRPSSANWQGNPIHGPRRGGRISRRLRHKCIDPAARSPSTSVCLQSCVGVLCCVMNFRSKVQSINCQRGLSKGKGQCRELILPWSDKSWVPKFIKFLICPLSETQTGVFTICLSLAVSQKTYRFAWPNIEGIYRSAIKNNTHHTHEGKLMPFRLITFWDSGKWNSKFFEISHPIWWHQLNAAVMYVPHQWLAIVPFCNIWTGAGGDQETHCVYGISSDAHVQKRIQWILMFVHKKIVNFNLT